jgi:excisionase family DNA binding protein
MTVMEREQIEWLTVEEIAKELKAKETSVRDWIRGKRLTSYKFGKRIMVKRSDLEKFIERSKQ